MWSDLNTLLSVKIECHRDALEAGAGGTLSVNKGAETFTLSWFEQISLSVCRLPVCTQPTNGTKSTNVNGCLFISTFGVDFIMRLLLFFFDFHRSQIKL